MMRLIVRNGEDEQTIDITSNSNDFGHIINVIIRAHNLRKENLLMIDNLGRRIDSINDIEDIMYKQVSTDNRVNSLNESVTNISSAVSFAS
jgi:hypothetical protein